MKIKTWTQDNMFFGQQAIYASVLDNSGNVVKEFSPPFAKLQARFFVLKQRFHG